MSGQTLHQDYYPLSLMKVGFTLCTGESACMLTGRREMPTDIVFKDVKRKTTTATTTQRIDPELKPN